ncbi:MAG TPA: DUF2461 domain-containing protein [Candidatus Dormibacteraeota bacterium]|nr:DUF2461 domain-containing protein [Candidatus Dormibacteraeota bacterium]
MAERFEGFRPEALSFLVELALNNERSWFQPRKGEYERLLKDPLERLCLAVGDEFRARHLPLTADARSPFRIYRDVRFSRDKSPYKTAVSASFPWSGEGGGVGGYFHLEPDRVFVGGGMWHPSPARLAAWRQAVVGRRDEVHAVIDDPAFEGSFGALDGDRLTRAPAGYSSDDPDVDLLRLKDVTFGRRLADAAVQTPELPAAIAAILEPAVPFLGLLARLPGHEEGVAWLRD